MFISLWTTRLVLNALGASDYGIYTIVGGSIALLGFLNATMTTVTQRFMNYYHGSANLDKCKEVFNVSIILHFYIALLLILILLIAGFFFFHGILNIPSEKHHTAVVIYLSLVVSTAFTAASVPYDATLNAHENMRYYAIIGIIDSFLKLCIAFSIVNYFSDKLIAYGVLMACVPILSLTIMRLYCHRYYNECVFVPSRYFNKQLMKEMSAFAGWRFLSTFSSFFTQYGLGIILNHFYGTLLNAAQGIANQLSALLMNFCNSMLKALSPVITKEEGAGEHQRMIDITLLGNKYSFFLLAIFAIPCSLEMSSILKIWLGRVPEWCVLFCQLQLFRSVIEQLFITLGTAINAQGQIKEISIARFVLNALPFVFTYILFSLGYPPYYMYVVWIFFYSLLGGIVMVYYSKRICLIPYSQFINKVIRPCLVVTIMMIVFGAIPISQLPSSFMRVILTTLLTTMGMIISMMIFMSNLEKRIFRDIYLKVRSTSLFSICKIVRKY